MTDTKRKLGRPHGTTRPTQLVKTCVGIRKDQRDKFIALGGSQWLREQIDKAKSP